MCVHAPGSHNWTWLLATHNQLSASSTWTRQIQAGMSHAEIAVRHHKTIDIWILYSKDKVPDAQGNDLPESTRQFATGLVVAHVIHSSISVVPTSNLSSSHLAELSRAGGSCQKFAVGSRAGARSQGQLCEAGGCCHEDSAAAATSPLPCSHAAWPASRDGSCTSKRLSGRSLIMGGHFQTAG